MAKKKDLKEQNPKFVIDLVEILAENDPSSTNKYLPFMVKQAESWVDWLKEELKSNTFKEMFDIVKEFENGNISLDDFVNNRLSTNQKNEYNEKQIIIDSIFGSSY